MADIRIHVDMAPVLQALEEAPKQVNFAVAKGLNQLANMAQQAERAHIKAAFRLRREQFVLRSVYISKADRARKDSWSVTIQIRLPDDRHFLQDHEAGGVRTARGKYLWQPNPKVFQSKVISRGNSLHPKNLGLRRGKGGLLEGNRRTFLLRTVTGERLILQRQGSARDRHHLRNDVTGKYARRGKKARTPQVVGGKRAPDPRVRMLYRLVKQVTLPARLEFVSTVGQVVRGQWQQVMEAAMAEAMRTRR